LVKKSRNYSREYPIAKDSERVGSFKRGNSYKWAFNESL